jgi:hypothetical protein
VPRNGRVADPNRSGREAWVSLPVAHRWQRARATAGPGSAPAIALVEPATAGGVAIALNRAAARWRVARHTTTPVDGLVELCASLGLEPSGMAAAMLGRPGRWLVGVASEGVLRAVVKVGDAGDADLRHEATVLAHLAPDAHPALRAPRLLWSGAWQGRFAVVTDAVARGRRGFSVQPSDVVDVCVGLATPLGGAPQVVHGDVAPWNIVRDAAGLTLVDWERAQLGADRPLWDLAHFVVQRAWLLGRSSPEGAVADLVAPGSPGWRYLVARGLDPRSAPRHASAYLRSAPERGLFHQRMLDRLA